MKLVMSQSTMVSFMCHMSLHTATSIDVQVCGVKKEKDVNDTLGNATE